MNGNRHTFLALALAVVDPLAVVLTPGHLEEIALALAGVDRYGHCRKAVRD